MYPIDNFPQHTKVIGASSLCDFCGSPGFFAPEIVCNSTYDGKCADVWSIGCVLLEVYHTREEYKYVIELPLIRPLALLVDGFRSGTLFGYMDVYL